MTSTPLPKITPAQREALHARGLTDEEIAQLTPEERQQFIANFTPEEGQKLFNGGGGSLAPDHAAPEATQSAPDSHEGFIPRELIPTPAAPPAVTSMSDITALRLQLRINGFHPIPLKGKIPPMKGWEQKFDVSEEEIRRWEKTYPRARNTGVLAKFAPGFDIDITIEAAAKAAEDKAREFLEEQEHTNIHVRFGAPPKR